MQQTVSETKQTYLNHSLYSLSVYLVHYLASVVSIYYVVPVGVCPNLDR